MSSKLSAIIHCNLGSIYYKNLRYKETISLLEDFLKDPNEPVYVDVFATMNLAIAISYHNIDEPKKAISYLKKCINLSEYHGNIYKSYTLYCTYSSFLVHSKRFEDSLKLISDSKKLYMHDPITYNNLLTQELLTYFHSKDYNKCLEVCKEITLNKLTKAGKIDYYFIKGWITEDIDLLKRCENYFINKFYYKDLIALYNKLYEITKNTIYQDYIKNYQNESFIKNIFA